MFNLTSLQLAQVKQQAITELLTQAKQANVEYNKQVIHLNEPDKVLPFTGIPITQLNNYLQTLKE